MQAAVDRVRKGRANFPLLAAARDVRKRSVLSFSLASARTRHPRLTDCRGAAAQASFIARTDIHEQAAASMQTGDDATAYGFMHNSATAARCGYLHWTRWFSVRDSFTLPNVRMVQFLL